MMEVFFYKPVDDYLKFSCNLVLKLYQEGKRILLLTEPENIDVMDSMLWTFNKTSFLPHATATDKNPSDHPIYIIDDISAGNVNQSDCVVSFLPGENIDFVEEVYIIINDSNKNQAREVFKALKKKNINLHYSEEI